MFVLGAIDQQKTNNYNVTIKSILVFNQFNVQFMRKVKVIIDYSKLSELELVELARNTALKMAANADVFVTPDIGYDALNAAAADLENSYHEAQSGDSLKIAIMNKAYNALLKLLHNQAMYVEKIADGDQTIILKSGFAMSKQPTSSVKPDFTSSNGDHSGEILLQHKAIKEAKSWVWQSSLDGTTWNQEGITTKSSFLVKGLTPVTKYWFRVAYISVDGQSEWSNAIWDVVK